MNPETLPYELLRLIQRIQLQTKKEVEELFAGSYRSIFKGRGMEFEEVREYVEGDDMRIIDWNVTARSQVPHVKTFCEERELTVLIAADISRSMAFRTESLSKREWMTRIAGTFALSAVENEDRVGLILFGDRVEKYIPPQKGFGHAFRLIRDLLVSQSDAQTTNLKSALDFVGAVHRRPAICFLFSDFLCEPAGNVLRLIAKKHDLFAVRIYDALEAEFPPLGLFRLRDQETGEVRFVDWSSEDMQHTYRQSREKFLQKHRDAILEAGGKFLDVRRGTPIKEALRPFFAEQRRRRR